MFHAYVVCVCVCVCRYPDILDNFSVVLELLLYKRKRVWNLKGASDALIFMLDVGTKCLVVDLMCFGIPMLEESFDFGKNPYDSMLKRLPLITQTTTDSFIHYLWCFALF